MLPTHREVSTQTGFAQSLSAACSLSQPSIRGGLQADEAAGKLRDMVTPYVGFSERLFQPLRSWFRAQDTSGSLQSSMLPVQELAKRMRDKLGHQQQHS